MDWSRGPTIGRGATATVSIATENGSGRVFAVKSCRVSESEFLQREQRILSTLDYPHIVGYKGCGISSENGGLMYNLFLEYARGGSVADEILRGGGGLDDRRIRSVTREVLMGLEYLHCNGVVHCDIKTQNVLVATGGAKIADLGCSRRVDDVSRADWTPPIMGTPLYMAPEVARGEEQGFAADVWALGCTIIEMATGRPPWVGVSDPATALYRIGFSGDVPEIPKIFSKEAKDFVTKCLIKDPRERWSASELLKHTFVNGPCSFDDCNVVTPTSVLNHGFWNSVEDGLLESRWDSRHGNRASCLSFSRSPWERIRKLSAKNTMLDWAWDETWVTVRGNGGEEERGALNISHHRDMLWAGEVRRANGGDTIWVGEECDLVSEIKTCNTSGESTRHEIKSSEIALACKCSSNHLLCRDITSWNKKVWFLVLQLLDCSDFQQHQCLLFFFGFYVHPLSFAKSQQFWHLGPKTNKAGLVWEFPMGLPIASLSLFAF